jgi:hypothetical protein
LFGAYVTQGIKQKATSTTSPIRVQEFGKLGNKKKKEKKLFKMPPTAEASFQLRP